MTKLFDGVYAGKTVLLTGHTGFKGGWLALWLARLGARVVGYSLDPPSAPSLFEAGGVGRRVTHVHGDILDEAKLSATLAEHSPEIVFHLAAQPLVRLSYADPLLTYRTNVMGTAHVLEAVRKTPSVRAVVNITSDKCYENREWVWGYRENEPMGGHDPYSSSKGCAELVASAYIRSFFPPEKYGETHHTLVASARAGNVIGGGDWGADRLVPDCARSLSRGEEIVIRFPHAIRPWQHVLEPLSGYLLLGSELLKGRTGISGGWNFGPVEAEVWPVERIVGEAVRLWGAGSWRVEDGEKPHEAHWLRLDCSKAMITLGWKPRYGVAEALSRTIAWYRRFYAGAGVDEMLAFTEQQIADYEAA